MSETVPAGDLDRVRRRLNRFQGIGETDAGGVTRLAYTPEEDAAFDALRAELPDEFDVRTDSVGNLFATPWPDAERSLYMGSHLDSVINGGHLDGTLGVVVALETIQTLHEAGRRPPNPPTLAVFRAEESARFGHHTLGSRAALGMLTVEDFSATDQNDVPLWHAMQQAGFHPKNLAEPTIDRDHVAGFLETHIEQGRVLDETGDDLGAVTSVRAPVRYEITVEGAYDHSGATPMGLRRDALAGVSAMILAIQRAGEEADDEGDLVATVGDVTAVDGAINKVCGEVSFPLDIRSVDEPFRDRIESRIVEEVRATADRDDLKVTIEELDRSSPVTLSEAMTARLSRAADAGEGTHRCLPSGGGHDAMNFESAGVPAGLLFVPSIDGISHSPDEATDDDAIAAAVRTFVRASLDTDEGIDPEAATEDDGDGHTTSADRPS